MNKQEKSWILYDVANSAYTMTVMSTIFPIFYKNVIAKGVAENVSTAQLGFANSLYTVIIALLAPVLGTISDYRGFKKRLLAFFLTLGVMVCGGLTFLQTGNTTMAILLYITGAVGFAGANIFYDSLLVDVTTSERMDMISVNGFAWGYIGSCVPFLLCMALILNARGFGFPEGSTLPVKISFIITGLWWALFSIPILKDVNQTHGLEKEKKFIASSFKRLLAVFHKIKEHKKVFLFLGAYFFYIDGIQTIIKMATAYGTDIGLSSTTLIVILLVTQVVAFPCALLFGNLARRFSAKKMLLSGIFIYILITLIAYMIPSVHEFALSISQSYQTKGKTVPGWIDWIGHHKSTAETALFWIVAMMVATSQGGMQALSRSVFGKLIPKKASGEFFGFYSIFGKFAAILGPALMGIIGYVTGHTRYGVLSLLVLFILGLVFLLPLNLEEEKNA